jgi:heme-degrading monooxygenase HmoA
MPYLTIRHKVQNYESWKVVFDEHATVRKAQGCKGGKLYRSSQDPSEVVIVFEWDDLKKAKAFTQSGDLRETMTKAGVTGVPEFSFLEESESFAA